ncbi:MULTISPECIES: DUF924 family protein [Neptunomonas]|uniref:DUF924 domain-containing protein n=1 Tax=Neptunomonas marina TaxID=1815562 RepID=A0A437QD30_9GAMM|nr:MULTISPECIES: DUF924 family protein [Neptunomonas]RVU32448.1 DUF924 domain-containing protein [Neptunomonas marina]
MREQIDEVLQFWFGDLQDGFPVADRSALWWGGGEALDQQVEALFGPQVRRALAGGLADWEETPRGRLALVILLDQFTRNIYRGSAEAFSGDEQACALVKRSLERDYDLALEVSERLFFYMPLEHSESMADQNLCVSKMEALYTCVDDANRDKVVNAVNFAKEHRDVIEQFGRFPHRNQALNRESTEKELAYLHQGQKGWGQ